MAASSLNHPSICVIHDIDEHEGKSFIVMEFLEGQTLEKVIAGTPIPVEDLIDVSLQIADALDAAHRNGIIHRDIKPANIFISNELKAKLLKIFAGLMSR